LYVIDWGIEEEVGGGGRPSFHEKSTEGAENRKAGKKQGGWEVASSTEIMTFGETYLR
jgi:hypothetical protein